MKKILGITMIGLVLISNATLAVNLSRCIPKTFVVTGYYSPLPNQSVYYKGSYEAEVRLNGEGKYGASGSPVFNGMIAAPKNYNFNTKIYFPNYGLGIVKDRGGAIVNAGVRSYAYDRVDIWMGYGEEGLRRALSFGKKTIKGYICDDIDVNVGFYLSKFPMYKNIKLSSGTTVSSTLYFNRGYTKGDKDAKIKTLQEYLKELGYYFGPINGTYDNSTINAVYDFQVKYGLVTEQTPIQLRGYFGIKTRQKVVRAINTYREKLKKWKTNPPKQTVAAAPNLKIMFHTKFSKGDKHNSIKTLQEFLIAKGFYEGEINGIYDEATSQAVFAFQVANKILNSNASSDLQGLFGPKTRTALNEQIPEFLKVKEQKELEAQKKEKILNERVQSKKDVFASTYKKGDKGEMIKTLQTWLTTFGYYNNEINGIYDLSTINAVYEFQKKYGIVDQSTPIQYRGYFGVGTKAKMNELIEKHIYEKEQEALAAELAEQKRKQEEQARLKKLEQEKQLKISKIVYDQAFTKSQKHSQIKSLQEHLQLLGYYNGDINGTYDLNTINAVYEFQLAEGILDNKSDISLRGYFGNQTREIFRHRVLEALDLD